MKLSQPGTGASQFGMLVKGAYWAAMIIIALVAMGSYMTVQQMLASHQRQTALSSLVNDQKVLSQRIVFLGVAAERAATARKPILVAALRDALEQFDANHDRLTGPDSAFHPGSLDGLLFGPPYHLDYYSEKLSRNARTLADSVDAWLANPNGSDDYTASRGWIGLDTEIGDRTLDGYAAVDRLIARREGDRLSNLMVLHRNLFWATIGIIGLVVLAIFRPMSEAIQRGATELVRARNAMQKLAGHDALTGLSNRTFLLDHFGPLLEAAQRRNERVAVVQIDLDEFKQINDTLGHAAGDAVLTRTGERLRTACGDADICARLGGDEFLLLLSDAGGRTEIGRAVENLITRLNEPLTHETTTIVPGASAGIAVFPDDAETTDDLLIHADLALYAAKRNRGSAFAFFSDEMKAELESSNQLKRDLRTAVTERAFSVHFQPQISLRNGKISGIEALARWTHPERGPISPAEFIPAAERAGLMSQLGRIVVEKAVATAAGWNRDGLDFGRLAINVSAAELREADFVTHLFHTLGEAGMPPEKLSLEIVESVILDDEKTGVAAKLRAVRAAGVHIELDDFGTGYASLSHVNPNEIDRLKIDRRFVTQIDADSDKRKIVRAITELARGLGISIIAEGAETTAELDSLMAIGCEHVQGYSVAFPMAEPEARDWIMTRAPRLRLSKPPRSSAA